MRLAHLGFTLNVLLASVSNSGCAPPREASRPASKLTTEADTASTSAEAEEFEGLRVDRYPPFVHQEWFPLVEGARYWYSGQFEGKVEQTKVSVVKHATPFGDVFYFADDQQMDDPSPLLFANMFGLAGYTTTRTEVLTIQASYFEGFKHARSAYVQTLLRLPLVLGDATQFRHRGAPVNVTVTGYERVTVPAGTFDDCIRIQIRDDPKSRDGESSVWLAKGVGLIKWHRKTGRIDELVRYEQPAPRDAPN